MNEPIDTRKASLDREWRPLTAGHESELARAEDTFERFSAGEPVDPLALVGGYRSGKTQLLYHLFRRSWERGIPAFYIGDSGAMLADFAAADTADLNRWLQARIEDQLAAYGLNNPDEISWFPNVDTQRKEAFVAAHVSVVQQDEPVRTALFFDEVEQSYREFIRVMDKDDDNPLRKINDGLQDSIKVWSFGMISAFEFIGEADWGRMREIRIPPLQVADVRELLSESRPEATHLANLLWWLARGRTGLIIKFLDSLPAADDAAVIEWIRELAETSFRDTRLLINCWTELDRDQWDRAIRALLFDSDGLGAWQISDTGALTATECQYLAVDILKDAFEFDDTETHQDALALLDRNLERVATGLAVSEDALFPAAGLAERPQAEAFLSLAGDLIVSFEPASDARSVALEALESGESVFHSQWGQRAGDTATIDREVSTVAPAVVQAVFPPIAVNPERVSDRATEDLRTEMDRGLTVITDTAANETAEIRLCPTETAFQTELAAVTDQADITTPTVLLVPDESDFSHSVSGVDVLTRHQLLAVKTYRSSRFWTFILHLHGRLAAGSASDPYRIDETALSALLADCADREVRNTIETLYDQVRQVAIDHLTSFERAYREAYTLEGADRLVWEEPRLDGVKPYWSSGKFAESAVALSYLPVVGTEYESDHATLHEPMQAGLAADLVASGRGGFQFKSYLSALFTQDGYSTAVSTERDHYRVAADLAPAVRRARDALAALAAQQDLPALINHLDDPKADLQSAPVAVATLSSFGHVGTAFLRALLVAGLTSGTDPAIDMQSRLEQVTAEIDALCERVTTCSDRVVDYNEQLQPPTSVTVGTWFDIETTRLDRYLSNLTTLRAGVTSLRERLASDPSVGPLAYHYWFMLRQYLAAVESQTESVETTIANTNVETISETVDLYDTLYERFATASFIDVAFDDRAELLTEFETYGNKVFDLQSHLEHTSVAIPDNGVMLQQVDDFDEQLFITDPESEFGSLDVPGDNDALQQVTHIIRDHKQHLMTIKRELDSIESAVSEIEELLYTSQDTLLTLLTADAPMEVDR